MNIGIPEWLAPWLIGAGLISIVLALTFAIWAYIQLRRAEYYVVREEARRRLLRGLLLAFLFAVITIGIVFLPRQAPAPAATPTPTLAPVASPAPTRAVPTPTATTTPTPKPTATEPFIPTSTPMATLPAAFTSPIPSAVPPPGDAHFEFWTLAQGVDTSDQPVDPGKQFPAGIERVYLFFRYDGLLPNVPWTIVWYKDGEVISGGARLWEPEQPSGERHAFLDFAGGFPVGSYEVQVWLGEQLQIRASFAVVGSQG
jgi:hypothetical protein